MNVGNCGHACEARPCGDAECRPLRDRFTCRCRPGMPHPCPAPDDNTILDSSLVKPNSGTRYERSVPSFSGSESYLHYNDADTMKRYGNLKVTKLNLNHFPCDLSRCHLYLYCATIYRNIHIILHHNVSFS